MQKTYKTLDEAKAATERFRDEYVALVERYGLRANVLAVLVTAEDAEPQGAAKMMISCNGRLEDIEAAVNELRSLALRLRQEKTSEKELYNFPEVIGE